MIDEGGRPSRFDAFLLQLARIGRALLSHWGLLLIAPIMAGSVAWFARGGVARLKLFDTNKLKFPEQVSAATGAGVGLGVAVLAVTLGYVLYARRRSMSFAALSGRLGAVALPLAAVPFVAALGQVGLEKESPKLTLFLAAVVAAIAGVSTYRWARSPQADAPISRTKERIWSALTWALLLGLWGGYAWFFARFSITNHHALTTRTIDLGLYDQIFWHTSHGRFLGCNFMKSGYHGSAHFDPFLAILSPLYRLYPRAEFILGFQSIWIGSGVIPVFLIARRQLGGRLLGLLVAVCYAVHPAIHGANMYEFHSLSLSCVPILWTLYCLTSGRTRLYWVALAVSLSVREDIPLMMSMVGLVSILNGDAALRRVGFFTVAASVVYFLVVKLFFMTSAGIIMSGPESYSYAYYYSEMIPDGRGIGGMLLTLVTNPSFVLRHALEEAKVLYLLKMFLPMAFLPFVSKKWRLTLAYGLAFTTLATREAVFSTAFQYSNTLLPFAFFSLPFGINQACESPLANAYGLSRAKLRPALVAVAVVASLAVSFKFGGFVENQAFKGGFSRAVRTLSDDQAALYQWIDESRAMIPADASVGVTNKIGPHVSNRKDAYFYGQRNVQYVFVDEKELKADRLKRHKKAIAEGRLDELSRRGSYALFKVTKGKKAKPKVEEPTEDEPKPEDELEPEEDVTDVLGDDPHE